MISIAIHVPDLGDQGRRSYRNEKRRGEREKGDLPSPWAEGRWNRYPVEYSIVAFNEKGEEARRGGIRYRGGGDSKAYRGRDAGEFVKKPRRKYLSLIVRSKENIFFYYN